MLVLFVNFIINKSIVIDKFVACFICTVFEGRIQYLYKSNYI